MNKNVRKSLYLCASALIIGGVVAPSISNNISASAHSRYAVSRYNYKKNIHKFDTKRMAHLQRIHKYHLRMEVKNKRNLANHKKALTHYNHLLRIHKHNRKMINNLTRSKRKLIRMIKNDQRGIARYAKYVESEEHQISLIKHNKNTNYHGSKGNLYFDGLKAGRHDASIYNSVGKLRHNIKAPRNNSNWYRGYAKGFDNKVNINKLHVSYYYDDGKLNSTVDVAGYRDNGPRNLIGGNGEHPYNLNPNRRVKVNYIAKKYHNSRYGGKRIPTGLI